MKVLRKFGTIAIIPVYHDSVNILKVLRKFKERTVDEICLITDEVSKQDDRSIAENYLQCSCSYNRKCNEKRNWVCYQTRFVLCIGK